MLLHTHSWYSLLDGTLSPEALVAQAAAAGHDTVALTDTGNLHGAVAFFRAAEKAGIRPILGAELSFRGTPLLVYVRNGRGYRNLCRLLTRHGRVFPDADVESVDTEGLLAVGADPAAAAAFPDGWWPGLGKSGRVASDQPVVAVPRVHHAPGAEDAQRWQVLQSIRTLSLLDQPHPEKRRAPAPLLTPAQIRERFHLDPDALARAEELADACRFCFDFGPLHFPSFHTPDGSAPPAFLRARVIEGFDRRYRGRDAAFRKRVRGQLEQELALIHEVGYEEYFLVVWQLLQDCRERSIGWITRGSAADSLVCYCLGISDVCPIRFDLYFRRFLNRERMHRNKLPDIDLDFAHDRKDDVVDLVFARYGRERAACVGGFSTFRARSALGEVGKVLGLSEFQVRKVTRQLPFSRVRDLGDKLAERRIDDLPLDEEPWPTALALAGFLDGLPRHAKMHPCGVVLSRAPMWHHTPCFTAPKGYPTTHFDMDDVEDIGLIKLDLLAQGGLAVIRDTYRMTTSDSTGRRPVGAPGLQGSTALKARCPHRAGGGSPAAASGYRDFAPWDDAGVWDDIAAGEARAVHHIESPAMISLARMCATRDIATLVAQVSVIRPGAANSSRKGAYSRRYQGLEAWEVPHPCLQDCLNETYGLIIYEEQVLQICEAFAGMTPGEADDLRRALVKSREEAVHDFAPRFVAAARETGRSEGEIRTVWTFLCGFMGYAFNKAHSAAYALEAYEAAWLKRNHPAAFMAGVLTHGKGFYRPLVYVLECYRLGLSLRPPDVNRPGPGFVVEPEPGGGATIRVPVAAVKHVGGEVLRRLQAERNEGAFDSPADFVRRVRPAEAVEALLRVGALDALAPGTPRTALAWELLWAREGAGAGRGGRQRELVLPAAAHGPPPVALDEPGRLERLEAEAELLGYTVSGHPLERYPDIAWETYCPVAELGRFQGKKVTCCGLVVEDRTTHQTTGELMKFMTLADRTGIVETELFAEGYRRHGLVTLRYPVLEVEATVEAFENGKGHTLRILAARRPRTRNGRPAPEYGLDG